MVLFHIKKTHVSPLVQVRDIAEADGGRLTLVFNPQWQTDGQIVSDFGCAQPSPALSCVCQWPGPPLLAVRNP